MRWAGFWLLPVGALLVGLAFSHPHPKSSHPVQTNAQHAANECGGDAARG